jgi:secretion/DNA translocation related TadE-like protein
VGAFRDRGSGTLWVVAFMALLWCVGVLAVTVGSVRAARHRAEVAADLAALGAAARVADGRGAVCRVAAEVAADAGARLSGCSVRGRIVDVTVELGLRVPFHPGELRVASRARAGPAVSQGVT